VVQGELSNLDVAIGPNAGLGSELDPAVKAIDRAPPGRAGRLVAGGCALHGLMSRRPEVLAVEIAQIDEEPIGIFRAIGAPCGEREPVPAGKARPVRRDQSRVAAVREHACPERGIAESARTLAPERSHLECQPWPSTTSAGNSLTRTLCSSSRST